MITYDFSLHVYDLLIHFKLTNKKHPFGMYLIMDYFAGNNQRKRKSVYNIFWTLYWGLATLFIVAYILVK